MTAADLEAHADQRDASIAGLDGTAIAPINQRDYLSDALDRMTASKRIRRASVAHLHQVPIGAESL